MQALSTAYHVYQSVYITWSEAQRKLTGIKRLAKVKIQQQETGQADVLWEQILMTWQNSSELVNWEAKFGEEGGR